MRFFALLYCAIILTPGAYAESDCPAKCLAKPGRSGSSCWQKGCSVACAVIEKSKGKPILSLSPDGQTLYLTGEVPLDDSDFLFLLDDGPDVPEALRAKNHERSQKVKFLVLNSPGGNVHTGKKIMDWVEKKGPNLKVVVPDGGFCGSVCAEIFRCAQNRVANKSAILMYHPSFLSGDKSEEATRKNKKFNEDFQNSSCAKRADQTAGGQKLTASLKAEKETCYSATELGGADGFLELEGGALAPTSGSSEPPPPSAR